ncbi:MAG: hypothetical protein LBR45_01660 [Bacteroidales bacterium]|jgi:hypothetical protein|nr:hypothetical protein [Bacteroidales bacterium]
MKTLLKVLCILTFIVSGLNFLGNSLVVIPGGQFWSDRIEEFKSEEAFEQMVAQNPQMEDMLNQAQVMLQNTSYFILMALLCAASIVGAAFMLKGKVSGFHIYTLAHLIIILIPLLIFRSMNFSISGTIFSLIIIGLYALAMFRKPANPETPISE